MDNDRKLFRRRFLKRSAALVGATAGMGLLARSGVEGTSGPAQGAVTMALQGTNWRLTYPDRRRGVPPEPGERSASFGQLLNGAGDEKVGEFYASSFQFGAPFGPSEYAAAAMEMHHFNLADGTIVGMGTLGGLRDHESVHAIIGGTGRYAGATGSYVARQSPIDLGGDGSAAFTFNMNLRSA